MHRTRNQQHRRESSRPLDSTVQLRQRRGHAGAVLRADRYCDRGRHPRARQRRGGAHPGGCGAVVRDPGGRRPQSESSTRASMLADLTPGARTALDAPRIRVDHSDNALQSVSTCSDLLDCSNLIAVHLPAGRWLVQAKLTVFGDFPHLGNTCGLVQSDTTVIDEAEYIGEGHTGLPDQRAGRIDRRRDHRAASSPPPLHCDATNTRDYELCTGGTACSQRSRSRTRRRRTKPV